MYALAAFSSYHLATHRFCGSAMGAPLRAAACSSSSSTSMSARMVAAAAARWRHAACFACQPAPAAAENSGDDWVALSLIASAPAATSYVTCLGTEVEPKAARSATHLNAWPGQKCYQLSKSCCRHFSQ